MNYSSSHIYGSITAASYDPSFLKGVKGGFQSLGIEPKMVYYILLVLVAAGSLYLIVRLVEALRRRLRPEALPAYMIGTRERIAEILQQAMDQRSKFEMRFLPSEYTRPVAVCSLLEYDARRLQFELDTAATPGGGWEGRLCEFYFRVKGDKKQYIYYRFTGTVTGLKTGRSGAHVMEIAFPETLELQQKRAHLRLEPPAQYLLGLAVWREPDRELPPQIKEWGRPQLRLKPDDHHPPLRLDDISAGGIRMTVTRDAMKDSRLDIGVGRRLYLMLDLYDPESSAKRRFLLLCRVQHVYEDFETRNMEYGLQFVSHGRLRKQGEEEEDPVLEVDWRPVDQDGVESLGSWIMKRHLELYRDKGII